MSGIPEAHLTIPEARELEKGELSDVELEQVLNDPQQLEWLSLVFSSHQKLFDTASVDCVMLSLYEDTIYLFDFDVVLSYLEGAQEETFDAYVVDFLFYESNQRYGLPQGAFIELIKYVNRLTKIAIDTEKLNEVIGTLDKRNAIIHFAQELNMSVSDEDDVDSIVIEITSKIDGHSRVAARLLRFLANERFIGVVSIDQQHDKDIQYVSQLLNKLPRRYNRGREIRDQNDAINVVTAFNSVKQARQKRSIGHKAETGFVLISSTRMVHSLPTVVAQTFDENADDHLIRLYSMIGVEGDIGTLHLINDDIHMDLFPLFSPQRVVYAEKLGVFDTPELALMTSRALNRNLGDVSNHLRIRLLSERVALKALTEARRSSIEQDWEQVKGTFISVAKQIFNSQQGGILEIEQIRANSITVEQSRKLQRGDKLTTQDTLLQKTTGFVKLLAELVSKLENSTGYRFEVVLKKAQLPSTVEEILVYQRPSYFREALLSCERYLTSDNSPTYTHFGVRWQILSTSSNKFFSEVRHLLEPFNENFRSEHTKNNIDEVVLVESSSSDYYDEGILIHTSVGIFGLPITQLLWSHSIPRDFHLKRLQQRINQFIESSNLELDSTEVVIKQFSVNTWFGDIIFDVEPSEGEKLRFVAVVSHCNLSTQIAYLYDKLGDIPIIPSRLVPSLNDILAHFETINT